jgi:histidyl-tRNA synthetase
MWTINNTKTNNILALWWRYNTLATRLNIGSNLPASWLKIDTEEVIDSLKNEWIKIKNKDKLDLYFVQLWDDAKKVVLPVSLEARKAWINTLSSLWTPSLKEQMLKAWRIWAKYVVIVWVMEAKTWVFQVRKMLDWTQKEVKKEDLIEYIIGKIWEENLDFYSPAKDLIKEV